jgi:predicted amidohydrolase YtcJ
MADLLIRDARIVRFGPLGPFRPSRGRPAGPSARPVPGGEPVDLMIRRGRVAAVGRGLDPGGARILQAEGAHAIPGLWDAHAHLDLEAARAARLDLSLAAGPEDVLIRVKAAAEAVAAGSAPYASVQGFGFRLSRWPRTPTVGELDEVSGGVPVVLVSGDVHSGWLNTAALRILGLRGVTGPMSEEPWFAALNRLDRIPGTAAMRRLGYRRVMAAMRERGVCGVVDMARQTAPGEWPLRAGLGDAPLPRIRAAVYGEQWEEWSRAGMRTGAALPGSPRDEGGGPLLVQGPLKIIADGSMGTMTAHLRDPYPAALGRPPGRERGVASIGRGELTELMRQAAAAGFETAVHAIGDAAVEDAVAAFEASGARGRIEHAQLLPSGSGGSRVDRSLLARIARAGVEVSVQPAHLLDDWSAVGRIWPGASPRCYAFADMVSAGIGLHLGSDAPVAPLDPWLAMAVAVSRRMPDGAVWSPGQRMTAEQALAASVDGQGPVGAGSRGDIVLVDRDPVHGPDGDLPDGAAGWLRATRVLATVVAGRDTVLS